MEAPKKIWLAEDDSFAEFLYQFDGDIPYIRADLVKGLVEALKMCVKHLDADGNLWSKEEQTMALAALKALEEE